MLALAALAAAPAAAQGPRIPLGLHYAVAAPRSAAYSLHCWFRTVRIRGHYDMDRGLVNPIDLWGKGPQQGPPPRRQRPLHPGADRRPRPDLWPSPYVARVAAQGAEANIYAP